MPEWSAKFSKEYSVPLIENERVLKPAIEKLVGSVKAKKIADLGCGSGDFSRFLAKKGAYVVGIDRNENQLRLAMQKSMRGVQYIRHDITNTKLKSNSFDVVLINLVFIEMSSLRNVSKSLKEAYRIMKKNGMLIVGETHPHALNRKFGILGMQTTGKNNYFDNGAKCKSVSMRVDGKIIDFYPDYHYTLEFYLNAIIESGFMITKILEPKWKEDFPTNIVIVAKKV